MQCQNNYKFLNFLISLDKNLLDDISRYAFFIVPINQMKLHFINVELKYVSFDHTIKSDGDEFNKLQWLIDQKIKIHIDCLQAMLYGNFDMSVLNLIYDNCEPGNIEVYYDRLNEKSIKWIHEKPDIMVNEDSVIITKN